MKLGLNCIRDFYLHTRKASRQLITEGGPCEALELVGGGSRSPADPSPALQPRGRRGGEGHASVSSRRPSRQPSPSHCPRTKGVGATGKPSSHGPSHSHPYGQRCPTGETILDDPSPPGLYSIISMPGTGICPEFTSPPTSLETFRSCGRILEPPFG